jgi:hypothetical protein
MEETEKGEIISQIIWWEKEKLRRVSEKNN